MQIPHIVTPPDDYGYSSVILDKSTFDDLLRVAELATLYRSQYDSAQEREMSFPVLIIVVLFVATALVGIYELLKIFRE